MRQVIKIALPGYNAFTDTNPDHFALYVDPDERIDYVLIKEKTYATVSVASSDSETIAHGLGYVPFCLVFVESSSGVWRKLFSRPLDGTGYFFEVTDTNLIIYNDSASAKSFSYHIFYDEIA
jgi:hypothetical protein